MSVVTLTKKFKEFDIGINELVSLVPEVKKYIGEDLTEKAIIVNMLDIIKNNVPSIYDPAYPSVYAINISFGEVSFKTRTYLSFGWHIHPTDEVTYTFRVSINTIGKFSKLPEFVEDLKDAEWKTKQPIVAQPLKK
jgi:hypothetical protein